MPLRWPRALTPQDAADVKRWCADAGCEVTFQRVKVTAGDHTRVAALRGVLDSVFAWIGLGFGLKDQHYLHYLVLLARPLAPTHPRDSCTIPNSAGPYKSRV